MFNRFRITTLATVLALGGAAMAFSTSTQATGFHSCEPTNTADWASVAALKQKVAADGFEYRRHKPDGGCYEVYIKYTDGRIAEAYYHPVSLELEVIQRRGQVLYQKPQPITSALPVRTSPIPATTNGVPHIQLGVKPNPAISAALMERVAGIPDVEIRDTVISLPGAHGFWLRDNVALANPQVIVGGREFAHIHPDGSLHAALPPELAFQAVDAGWATRHPWATKRPGWEGFVMLYTPTSEGELDVVFRLILDSYNFVTGRNLQPR